MRRHRGLDVPANLVEACRPDRSALVLYDLQAGILRQIADRDRVLARAAALLEIARAAKVRVVFVRHVTLPAAESASHFRMPASIVASRRPVRTRHVRQQGSGRAAGAHGARGGRGPGDQGLLRRRAAPARPRGRARSRARGPLPRRADNGLDPASRLTIWEELRVAKRRPVGGKISLDPGRCRSSSTAPDQSRRWVPRTGELLDTSSHQLPTASSPRPG